MAKAISIEDQLAGLTAIRSDPSSDTAKAALTRALSSKSNLVVAKAATIITDSHQPDFAPSIAAAFNRILDAGNDRGCATLSPLSNALYTLGHTDAAPFLRGLHYFQVERTIGEPFDAAVEVRGACALGLARMGYPDVLFEMAELLMDPMHQPRQMAARAIAYAGHESGSLLLRMKVLAGDKDSDVISECFIAMMAVAPKKSLPFVGRFLKSADPALAEAAALAIGGSRSMAAFEYLRAEWESHLQSDPRRPLLLGMAMTRQPAAIEFLLQRIADDRPSPAADAVSALAMYKHDESIKGRVKSLVEQVDDVVVTGAFKKAFA